MLVSYQLCNFFHSVGCFSTSFLRLLILTIFLFCFKIFFIKRAMYHLKICQNFRMVFICFTKFKFTNLRVNSIIKGFIFVCVLPHMEVKAEWFAQDYICDPVCDKNKIRFIDFWIRNFPLFIRRKTWSMSVTDWKWDIVLWESE